MNLNVKNCTVSDVSPTKTQISLRISVVFVVHMKTFEILGFPQCVQWIGCWSAYSLTALWITGNAKCLRLLSAYVWKYMTLWIFYTLTAAHGFRYCNPGTAEPGRIWHAFSNSVGPDQKPTDQDLHRLSFSMWICISNLDQVIWLADKIRSGSGILLYSAWQHWRKKSKCLLVDLSLN